MANGMTKDLVIESILGNESITDGLEDGEAEIIIQWCLQKIAAFPSGETLAEYGRHLVQQARTIAKIANHIQDRDDFSLIRRRLQKLTTDPAKQQSFIGLVNHQHSLNEYIHALLKIADGVI